MRMGEKNIDTAAFRKQTEGAYIRPVKIPPREIGRTIVVSDTRVAAALAALANATLLPASVHIAIALADYIKNKYPELLENA